MTNNLTYQTNKQLTDLLKVVLPEYEGVCLELIEIIKTEYNLK
jgi:hypothetical protein